MHDRRVGRRRAVAVDAVLRGPDCARYVRTQDLGLHGAFLAIDVPDIAAKTQSDLLLLLPYDGSRCWHHLKAEVVWHTARGIGVRFAPQDNRAYTALIEAVYGGRFAVQAADSSS